MPVVNITLSWTANPLTYTVNPTETAITVHAREDTTDPQPEDRQIAVPESIRAGGDLDLLSLEALIIEEDWQLQRAMLATAAPRLYRPFRPTHLATVTLPGGCTLRPTFLRTSPDEDQFIVLQPTCRFELRADTYTRPPATTLRELMTDFAHAADLVRDLVVDVDSRMIPLIERPSGLPQGTRVIPARKVRPGMSLVGRPSGTDPATMRITRLKRPFPVVESCPAHEPGEDAKHLVTTAGLEFTTLANLPWAVVN